MPHRIWFDRQFELGFPAEAFPDIVERLRGTPLRLVERVSRAPASALTDRGVDGGWSIQEHAGHLLDLEALWLGRVDDLVAGAEVLREADLENRATWDADHNARVAGDVLDGFRVQRELLVSRMEAMSEEQRRATALHPRLRQPMTVVDLAFFVAEHDDHHLATITALIARTGTSA